MNLPNGPVTVYRMSMADKECPWGLKAIALLKEKGIAFQDIKLTDQEAVNALKAKFNVPTTPQIFFGEERVGGYSDLAARLNAPVAKAEFSYVPVVAVFGVAALITLSLGQGFMGFMGIALCMLASLKLMDMEGFAAGFAKYDLLSKRVKPYAWAYPVIELGLGLALLAKLASPFIALVSLAVGVIGAVSVVKAVYIDKMEINCACIGGNSKAPLGVVSLLENLMMVAMGVMLLIGTR